MFKFISLIIIIIMLATCVFVLFGEVLTGPFIQSGSNVRDYSFYVSQTGNIYYVRKDGDAQTLVALDSTGAEWLRTDIAQYFGQYFFVDSFYVPQSRNIWMTIYEYEPDTRMIISAKIAEFHEDGSYIGDRFYFERTAFVDSRFRFVSSMGEDENHVYFAIRDIEHISVYAYRKGDSSPPRKTAEYYPTQPDSEILAFHATSDSGLVVSYSDGSVTLYNMGKAAETLSRESADLLDARIDHFWGGANVFYARDVITGTVYYSPPQHLSLAPVVDGDFEVSSEKGIRFKDFNEVAFSGVGNVLGGYRTGDGIELFMGGYTFLPSITFVGKAQQAELTNWLVLIAVIAVVLVVSVLIWEFFIHFMRMKMSLIIKQVLLSALAIFIAFYALSEYALIPNAMNSLTRAYDKSLSSSAEVLLSAMKSILPPDSPDEDYSRFLGDYGARYNLVESRTNPQSSYLFVYDGGYQLIASSDRHPPGTLLSAVVPYSGVLQQFGSNIPQEGVYVDFNSKRGRQLAFIQSADIYTDGRETVLCIIENLSILDSTLGSLRSTVNDVLLIAGSSLLALLTLIIVIHVITLKKLRLALHTFGLGRYDKIPEIRSGDETGEIYEHIKSLADVLVDKQSSLQILSTSYHRFIPERFLKLLGETRLENVGKDLQTRIEGANVVFVRFSLSGDDGMGVFEKANLFLENIVPIVAQNGGTVYNFSHNGFEGIFENSAADALAAALSIRDMCKKFDMRCNEGEDIRSDLRIVLIKDDLTLGFIGDSSRMEPTAISDAYSIAEPLMRICWGSSVYIAATKEFCNEIKAEDYRIRRLGKTSAGKGTVELYDIYDSDPPTLLDLKISFADKFEVGINLFEKGDYNNARGMFMEIIKHSTADGISRDYLYLSDYNMRNTDKRTMFSTYSANENGLD